MPRPKLRMLLTEPVKGFFLLTSWPLGQTKVWAFPEPCKDHEATLVLRADGSSYIYQSRYRSKRRTVSDQYDIVMNRTNFDPSELYCDPSDAVWCVEEESEKGQLGLNFGGEG